MRFWVQILRENKIAQGEKASNNPASKASVFPKNRLTTKKKKPTAREFIRPMKKETILGSVLMATKGNKK